MEDTRNHRRGSSRFVGSAVVAGASYGPRSTLLRLQTFAGEYIDYALGGIPDPAGAAEFRSKDARPISVKIQHGGERCSVIALTSDGPRRSNVTLGTALALQQSGVYAVIDGALQIGKPCSVLPYRPERPDALPVVPPKDRGSEVSLDADAARANVKESMSCKA